MPHSTFFERNQDLVVHVRDEPCTPVVARHQSGNTSPCFVAHPWNAYFYAPDVVGILVIDHDRREQSIELSHTFILPSTPNFLVRLTWIKPVAVGLRRIRQRHPERQSTPLPPS